jgi:hypothetical protein
MEAGRQNDQVSLLFFHLSQENRNNGASEEVT